MQRKEQSNIYFFFIPVLLPAILEGRILLPRLLWSIVMCLAAQAVSMLLFCEISFVDIVVWLMTIAVMKKIKAAWLHGVSPPE